MRGSRRWHAVILVGAVLTAAVLLAPAGGSQASTSTNNNACFTAVSSTYADVPVTMSGTATPSSATLGVDTVTLSGTTAQATFSAALFLAGYRLQILQVGSNSVAADVTAGVIGTNTQEGSVSETVSTTQTVVIVDPTPANRSSGDESAQPVTVTLNLGSSTWTPTGGNISFKQGVFSVTAKVGPINVVIGPCNPGTATGCDGAGANCTGKTDNPNPTPFAAVTVVTGPPPTTQAPTTTGQATTTSGGQATTTTGGQATTTTAGQATTTTKPATTTTKPATTTTAAQATTTTKPATTTTAGQATTTTTGGATTTTISGGGTISGSAAYTTECTNSVTADKSAIGFTAAGTIPASVTSGTPFLFSKQQWSVSVPGSVLQTGINLGLLTPGQKINGTVDVTVSASNTLEGSRTATGIPLSITVQPTDVKVDFPVPDMSFTPAGGKIDIRFTKASMSVSIGLPAPVVFTCNATNNPVIVSVTASGPVIPTTTTTPPPTTTKPTSTTVKPTSTTVASSGTGTLPATGPRQLLGQLILAAVLLDLGYLALSALRPPRRRPLS